MFQLTCGCVCGANLPHGGGHADARIHTHPAPFDLADFQDKYTPSPSGGRAHFEPLRTNEHTKKGGGRKEPQLDNRELREDERATVSHQIEGERGQ